MGASEHFVSLYVHLSPLECNFFVTIGALLKFTLDDRPAFLDFGLLKVPSASGVG